MTFTDEQIMKEVKKNRKLIKQIGKTVNWWLFLFAVILAVFVLFTPAHAAFVPNNNNPANYNNSQYVYIYSPEQKNTGGSTSTKLSSADVDAWCKAVNGPSSTGDNSQRDIRDWADAVTQGSGSTTMGSWPYKIHYYVCSGGSYTWYGMKLFYLPSMAGNYTPEFSYTAVPQSGNQSLNVLFTPTVRFNSTSGFRIVWDYDGGLGTETKYNDSTSFTKIYNAAGHFVSRATLYDGSTMVSASKNIDVYNYTLGITPTPTLTPTPTPTPQQGNGSAQWKTTGYDSVNNTGIAGLSIGMIDADDVGSGWFNVTASSGTYTFNGYGSGGSKPFVNGHHYMFQLSKSGYTTFTSPAHQYLGAFEDYRYPMVSSSNSPTASTFVLNIDLQSQLTGSITTPLVGTVTISNQSSSWTSSSTNPQAGRVTFSGLTPASSYKIDITVTGYEIYTGVFASGSGMAGTTQLYQAILIPKTTLPSAFTLSVAPKSGTQNETYSLTLSGDISTADRIQYEYCSSIGGTCAAFTTSGVATSVYSKIGGSWKGWDGSSFTVSTSNPASVSGHMGNLVPSANTVYVTAYITINGNVYQAMDTITLISTGKIQKKIIGYDMSGSGAGTFAPFTAHIYDIYAGTWNNITVTSNDIGIKYVMLTPNALYSYYGSASGYYDTAVINRYFTGNTQEGEIELRFYKQTGGITVGNTTLYVHTKDLQNKNIQGVRAVFNDGQRCYTDSIGSCGVNVLSGVEYTVTTTAYGYVTGVASILTSNTSSNVLEITMLSASNYGNNTVTIKPTGTARTQPTFSNTSGFNNTPMFAEFTCNTDTANMGIFDLLMNNVACAGVHGATQQGFVLSALIMFIFAMGLASKGRGLGALAGTIIGAVVSFGMNILPFWILIVVIIICGLVFARMITSSSSGDK